MLLLHRKALFGDLVTAHRANLIHYLVGDFAVLAVLSFQLLFEELRQLCFLFLRFGLTLSRHFFRCGLSTHVFAHLGVRSGHIRLDMLVLR